MSDQQTPKDTLCHTHSRSLSECKRKGSEGCYVAARSTEATLVDRLRADANEYRYGYPENKALLLEAADALEAKDAKIRALRRGLDKL